MRRGRTDAACRAAWTGARRAATRLLRGSGESRRASGGPTPPASLTMTTTTTTKTKTTDAAAARDRVAELAARCASSQVRNFVVTAHIDAGKSTLSDRLLNVTGNLSAKDTSAGQVLDTLRVERERGITVKAQTATMQWRGHLLNLIDTPGHTDFSFEVLRSLAACEGAVLLVDSTHGVEAQTMANHRFAVEAGLAVVPCLTKLDLKTSDPARCLAQMESIFGIPEHQVLWTSARTGEGVDALLDAVVHRVPPPAPSTDGDALLASVVDLWHDQYKGVVMLVVVRAGRLRAGDRVVLADVAGAEAFEVKEAGVLLPQARALAEGLGPGRCGYMFAVNVRGAKDAYIGARVVRASERGRAAAAIPAARFRVFDRPKPTVFASVYPIDAEDFDDLRRSITKLALNDSSVALKQESIQALGQGFRAGFLGTLHMEVFVQRLEDEFGAKIICTAPSVPYTVEKKSGERAVCENAAQLPEHAEIQRVFEPMSVLTLVTPVECVGAIMEALQARRGRMQRVDPSFDGARTRLVYRLPWQEAVSGLHDEVKALSSGFASYDLREAPEEEADIVRVDVLLNGERAEPLSIMCHRSAAEARGRRIALRLKETIPPQVFDVAIQAAVWGSRVVARESIRGVRKDVLSIGGGKVVGGGDKTRKMKLLERQKAGKKRLKAVANVQLSQDAFLAVLDKGPRSG